MARDFFINGESLVLVKGAVGTAIASLSELGLADTPIQVSPQFEHMDINVNAWGRAPADVQWMLGWANISMQLVHFDANVLDVCIGLSMGGAPAIGAMGRAGQRMGAGVVRFAAGNRFVGLNIASPGAGKPYRFLFAYLATPPYTFPLGNERSLVQLNWRAIPFTTDPYGGGTGALGAYIWDHNLDS